MGRDGERNFTGISNTYPLQVIHPQSVIQQKTPNLKD